MATTRSMVYLSLSPAKTNEVKDACLINLIDGDEQTNDISNAVQLADGRIKCNGNFFSADQARYGWFTSDDHLSFLAPQSQDFLTFLTLKTQFDLVAAQYEGLVEKLKIFNK